MYRIKYDYNVGDGDSKVYKAVCDAKPYGDFIIEKKECVGHVQKRMGIRLRNLKTSYCHSKKLSDAGSIEYYGNANREHSDSHDKMSKAI